MYIDCVDLLVLMRNMLDLERDFVTQLKQLSQVKLLIQWLAGILYLAAMEEYLRLTAWKPAAQNVATKPCCGQDPAESGCGLDRVELLA